jgi:dienelactone hydrolase
MRRLIARLALAAAAVAATALAAPAADGPQPVDIAAGDKTLRALLFRPEGDGPFPAVVAMHGCAGLYTAGNEIAPRYRDWAQHLMADGFAVLFPDSYGSRGLGSQCRVRVSAVRTDRDRVADADAARAWLQAQAFVKPDRISLIGWSNGGISVLWTVRPQAKPAGTAPDFRSAVAFYPGCRRLDNTAWSARIPTLILIGSLDDWNSARECEQMVAGARGRSARIALVVYPGAFHDFDHPHRLLQQRTGYAFSVDGTGRVHTGTNPAARADALRRVPQWLAR